MLRIVSTRRIAHLFVLAIIVSATTHGGTLAVAQVVHGEPGAGEEFADEMAEDEFEEEEEEEEDELESDRDSFTRSPRLMPPGQTMVEFSHTFLDQPAAEDGHLYPDMLIRYGTSELLELRLGWNYESAKYQHLAPPGAEPGEEGILIYGTKLCMTKACCGVPDSALILTGYTPTTGESNDTDFSLEYVFGWRPGEWEIDGQVRWIALAEEEDHFTEWAPSVVVKRNLGCSRRFNAHVEYFSLHSSEREENYHQHFFGPGAHYLITPNLEIGARVFWGLSQDAADFVSNVGLAARF